MVFPVFLDTCVLYPPTLNDTLLRTAEQGVFRPYWSKDVLNELERNLAKLENVGSIGASKRVNAMQCAFEDAMVTGYEYLLGAMNCDPKDAHVLAAAAASGCQSIVTFNLKDFPTESTKVHNLTVVHPDEFMLDQFDLYPERVRSALRKQSCSYQRPKMSIFDLFDSLERCNLKNFADEMRRKF